jgi:hypothetical protein
MYSTTANDSTRLFLKIGYAIASISIISISILIGYFSSEIETTSLIINLLILILFVLCIAPLVFQIRKGKIDIFHTTICIPLVYFLYFGIGFYLYRLRIKYLQAIETVHENSIIIGITIAIIGIIFYYTGYFFINKITRQNPHFMDKIPMKWGPKKVLFFIFLSLFFFISINLLLWKSTGGIPLLVAQYYEEVRSEIMTGKGYFAFVALSIVPINLLILNTYWRLGNKTSSIISFKCRTRTFCCFFYICSY